MEAEERMHRKTEETRERMHTSFIFGKSYLTCAMLGEASALSLLPQKTMRQLRMSLSNTFCRAPKLYVVGTLAARCIGYWVCGYWGVFDCGCVYMKNQLATTKLTIPGSNCIIRLWQVDGVDIAH